MHDRAVIVFHLVVSDSLESIFVEVVGGASLNQVESDLNVLVAFRCRLHVVEANGMDELMHDGVEAEAADFEVVGLQVEDLPATSSSNRAVASAVVATHLDVVDVDAGVVGDELQASFLFHATSAVMNVGDLCGGCGNKLKPNCRKYLSNFFTEMFLDDFVRDDSVWPPECGVS